MASSFRSFCSLLHTEAAAICKSALAKFGVFFQQVIRHLRALNELVRGFACRVTFDFPIYWRLWNGFPDRLAFHGGTPERMQLPKPIAQPTVSLPRLACCDEGHRCL
jgi:hypothetical protein